MSNCNLYFGFLKYTNNIPPFKGTIDELFLMVSVALKSVTDQVYVAACLGVQKNTGSSNVYIWLRFLEGL